jgi:transmembrane 9 superfamily protein 2/4
MVLISALLLGYVLNVLPTVAFYLPGAAPHDYKSGEPVELFVNALTPMLSGDENAKLVRLNISPVHTSHN